MANASFGLGESPFIFASVCKCEGVQRIFGSITKGAPALHKLYTRERHFSLNLSGGIRRLRTAGTSRRPPRGIRRAPRRGDDAVPTAGGMTPYPRRGDDAVPTAGGKKEGQPAVFLPLWTPTFPLDSLAQIADM